MFQTGIEKGFITKKFFDDILEAYQESSKEGKEILEKYLRKKKGRPGATSMDVNKEEIEEMMNSTLFSLFLSDSEEPKIR